MTSVNLGKLILAGYVVYLLTTLPTPVVVAGCLITLGLCAQSEPSRK